MGEAKFRARRSATPGTDAISSLLKHTSLHDHGHRHSSASPDSPSADTTSGASMVRPPEFLRSDAQTLTAIRSLPRSSNLVLFTPVVPPEPELSSSAPAEGGAVQEPPGKKGSRADADAPMDPFEPFGRALSRYHSRVRHVPYVPSAGMTSTHQTFLEHAAAVVIVVACNSNSDQRHPRPRFEPASGSHFQVRQPGQQQQQQQQQQQRRDHYRSPYPLPPRRQSSTTPTPDSVKAEQDFSSLHRTVLEMLPSDPPLRFVTQALIASWDLEQQRPVGSAPIPTAVLLVDEYDDSEFEVSRIERLVADLVDGWHHSDRPGYRTLLGSRSYSARALRNVAELMFESEV